MFGAASRSGSGGNWPARRRSNRTPRAVPERTEAARCTVASMIKLKQVAIRKDDKGSGWQTILDVEIQFGTIEPHTVTIAVPHDAETSFFGTSPQEMVDLGNQYAKKVFTEAASKLD